MDTRTGEIREFAEAEKLPPHFVPIPKAMLGELTKTEQKDRIWMYKKLKRKLIRAKKRELGRRLTSEEMVELFAN